MCHASLKGTFSSVKMMNNDINWKADINILRESGYTMLFSFRGV